MVGTDFFEINLHVIWIHGDRQLKPVSKGTPYTTEYMKEEIKKYISKQINYLINHKERKMKC